MKLGTSRSPKFRRLAQILDRPTPEVIGYLELLWQFTIEYARRGDVGRWTDVEIELECEWQGAPGGLIEALVDTGWLDLCTVHRLVVHDWEEHAPSFLKKRIGRAKECFAIICPPPKEGAAPSGDQAALNGAEWEPVMSCHAESYHAESADERRPADTDGEEEFGLNGDPPEPKTCSEQDDGLWLLPQLGLNADATGATEDELARWFGAKWLEIRDAAVIEGENPSKLSNHARGIGSARWNKYLQTRDPQKREFFRDSERAGKRAALERSKAEEHDFAPDPDPGNPVADITRYAAHRAQEVAP